MNVSHGTNTELKTENFITFTSLTRKIDIMALIKWGMFVVDGRCKVGGHVLTKTRHGATVRTKVTPSNPRKPAQQQIRAIFGTLSSSWNGLTEAQRAGFNEAVEKFAKTNIFGDLKNPTGRELFIRCNMGRQQLGLANIVNAPEGVAFPPTKISEVVFDLTSDNLELIDLDSTILTDFAVQVSATAPQSPGRYNFQGAYRIIINDQDTDWANLHDEYEKKFGLPADGQAVGVRVALISRDTGLKSVEEDFRVIAAL